MDVNLKAIWSVLDIMSLDISEIAVSTSRVESSAAELIDRMNDLGLLDDFLLTQELTELTDELKTTFHKITKVINEETLKISVLLGKVSTEMLDETGTNAILDDIFSGIEYDEYE